MTNARTRFVKRDLAAEHEVLTVEEVGLKGLKNGALLNAAADNRFDVLVTVDQNIPYQQNTGDLTIAILLLVAKSNSYARLQPLMPQAVEALKAIRAGEVVRIEAVT